MKLKQLSLVAAAALSAQAFALTPADLPADIEIRISGASAQDKALAALVGTLCTNLDTYRDLGNPAKPGAGYTSYFCEMGASAGLGSTQKVLIHKRSAGGSGQGVQPVADAVAIDGMVIDNGNCANVAPGEYECTISNPGDLISVVSDAGISDVEPALFTGPNVPAGSVPVTAAQLAKIDVTSMNAVIFGIPVTNALYQALQEVQYGAANVGSNLEEHMPSLSKSQVASLFSGGLRNWDDLQVNDGLGGTVGLASFPFAAAAAPTLDVFGPFTRPLVHICRRVPGSGTQAQFNAKFTNSPCNATATPPLTAGSPINGPIVQLNSGSGDVTTCLNDKQAINRWALGIQSLEKNSPSWKFIKIDHVAPTLQNVAYNNYFDWVETTMQWRNAANGGPSGDTLTILQTIAANASGPATIQNLNAGFAPGFFDSMPVDVDAGAYLALTTNGHTPTTGEFVLNNPVATATHAFSGTPNSCSTPIIVAGGVSSLSFWVGGHIGW